MVNSAEISDNKDNIYVSENYLDTIYHIYNNLSNLRFWSLQKFKKTQLCLLITKQLRMHRILGENFVIQFPALITYYK